MQKRKLGNSSLEIVPLVFGGNVFGWTVNEDQSLQLLDEFYAGGFNCIDTADVYSTWVPGHKGGESETIIGKWLKRTGKRKEMIIATKCGFSLTGGKNNLSRDYILKCCNDSLRRLQTDYIDLYQSHVDDPETQPEETLRAYEELIRSGKVRAIGCSNFSAARIEESLRVSKEKNLPPYVSLQPEYNLYEREKFEKDVRDVCLKNNLGVIVYYPLAAGFLSGKYRNEKDLENKARAGRLKRYLNARGLRIIDALTLIAEQHNAEPAEIALAWVLHQPGITAPIASATSVEQLKSNMKCVQIRLSEKDLKQLDEASA